MESPTIGLIAGRGKFPFLFAHQARAQKRRVVTAAICGDTSIFLKFFVDQWAWFKVGELTKLLEYFKKTGVRQVIMAGYVKPENLFDPNVTFDPLSQKILDGLDNQKTDTLLSAVAEKFNEHGLELMDSTLLLKEFLAPKGTLTRRGPTLVELDDIAFGKEIAKGMGGLDVGQTVVVKEKTIIAVEAMEGTDRTIIRAGTMAQGRAVVVKMSKPQQDLRFDVPVIGPKTIRTMIKSGASCLAVEAGKTFIIDRPLCIKLADKAGICILAA
jgi:DUF1009 family protein